MLSCRNQQITVLSDIGALRIRIGIALKGSFKGYYKGTIRVLQGYYNVGA